LDEHWWIPSAITVIRIIFCPLFFHALINDQTLWTISVFLFACSTDVLDGYFARRLSVSSSTGAYFDVIADFLLVLTGFSGFVIKGIYPLWASLLIGLMFIQFIFTSILGRILYDPIGRYYGAFLFNVIGVTLALPRPPVHLVLLITVLGMTIVSVASRSAFFLLSYNLFDFNCKRIAKSLIEKSFSTLLSPTDRRLKGRSDE